MRKVTLLSAIILVLFSCSSESITNNNQEELRLNPNFRVSEFVKTGNNMSRASLDEPCMTTNLIAGQNHIAGTVSVDVDGDNLIITYSTNSDWSIDATHLSIGNCAEQTIPTTGSGNPKIGHFEHSTNHSSGVNEVVYMIDKSALDENYCFAAHAEVVGPTGGETAWAEGPEFDGNSWAMYVEALLSDCDVEGEKEGEDEEEEEEEPPVK